MKKIMVTVSCALLVAAFVAVENCKAEELKVAYVDLQQFMQKSKKAQDQLQKLQQLVAAKRTELENKVKQFKDMQDELQKQGPIMKEDTRNKKAEELQIEQFKLKRQEEEFNKSLQKEEVDFQAALQRDVTKIVDQIRAKKGLTIVLSRAMILSVDDKLDITDEVTRGYDGAPAAAAAPPAPPKPKAPPAPAKAPAAK